MSKRLFKEMRKTVPDGGLFEKSNAGEIYSEMLDEEYSKLFQKVKVSASQTHCISNYRQQIIDT